MDYMAGYNASLSAYNPTGYGSFGQNLSPASVGSLLPQYKPSVIGEPNAANMANAAPFAYNASLPNQKSISQSSSNSGVDRSALGLYDGYFSQGMGYLQGLYGQDNTAQRLSTLGGYYDQASQLASTLGGTTRAQINRSYNDYGNSIGAQTAATGLYNSTIGDTMRMSSNRDRQVALSGLDEQLRSQQMGLVQQRAGATDQIYGDQLGYLSQLGQIGAGMYQSRYQNIPTYSTSSSVSNSEGRPG